MKIQFIKTEPNAKLPAKNHTDPLTGDVGYDLFATKTIQIPAGDSRVIPVGLKLAFITPGYWFRIEARSGLGFKKGIQPHFGIIDNPYRGDLGIKVYNLSNEHQTIEEGNGVAQFVVYEMIKDVEVSFTDKVIETERGESGFGSSDKI